MSVESYGANASFSRAMVVQVTQLESRATGSQTESRCTAVTVPWYVCPQVTLLDPLAAESWRVLPGVLAGLRGLGPEYSFCTPKIKGYYNHRV